MARGLAGIYARNILDKRERTGYGKAAQRHDSVMLDHIRRQSDRYLLENNGNLTAEFRDDSVLYWENAPKGEPQSLRGRPKHDAITKLDRAVPWQFQVHDFPA